MTERPFSMLMSSKMGITALQFSSVSQLLTHNRIILCLKINHHCLIIVESIPRKQLSFLLNMRFQTRAKCINSNQHITNLAHQERFQNFWLLAVFQFLTTSRAQIGPKLVLVQIKKPLINSILSLRVKSRLSSLWLIFSAPKAKGSLHKRIKPQIRDKRKLLGHCRKGRARFLTIARLLYLNQLINKTSQSPVMSSHSFKK